MKNAKQAQVSVFRIHLPRVNWWTSQKKYQGSEIMNKIILFALSINILLVGCVSHSENRKNQESSLHSIIFKRTVDLRACFRSLQDIEQMEREGVCSIEAGGVISQRRTIHVGLGMPLNRVIELLYGHSYDGQIKVVSCNSILQTSQVIYQPEEQSKINVGPGDLVCIGPRD